MMKDVKSVEKVEPHNFWEDFYGCSSYKKYEDKVKNIKFSKGVCAKTLTEEDIGWFCQNCQKDSNCIMCQSCFENSDHTGHAVYLDRHVGGCCDCGDPEAFDPKGFCKFHQGFIEEEDASFTMLPKEIAKPCASYIQKLCTLFFDKSYYLGCAQYNEENAKNKIEIEKILAILMQISSISPIFMYEVCRNLIQYRDIKKCIINDIE